MQLLENLPVWLLAVVVFSLRIVDVSLGTVRTIAVVQGWIKLSVVLGFFELLIWIAAVSQVIARVKEQPILMLAFAGGFAAGNAAGILLERVLALGTCVVRIVSADKENADKSTIAGSQSGVQAAASSCFWSAASLTSAGGSSTHHCHRRSRPFGATPAALYPDGVRGLRPAGRRCLSRRSRSRADRCARRCPPDG